MATTRQPIESEKAPAVLGPYSLGIKTESLVFLSGTIGVDPAKGQLVEGGVEAEARQALTNMGNLLAAADADFQSVVKTTVFLTDMADYAAVNRIYAEFFGEVPPARSAVEVGALPGGALVEIEAIAQV